MKIPIKATKQTPQKQEYDFDKRKTSEIMSQITPDTDTSCFFSVKNDP